MKVQQWVFIAVTTLLSAAPLRAQDGPRDPDRAAIEAAVTVMNSNRVSEIWPGYAGPKEFVLCPSAGGALLVLESPPEGVAVHQLDVDQRSVGSSGGGDSAVKWPGHGQFAVLFVAGTPFSSVGGPS